MDWEVEQLKEFIKAELKKGYAHETIIKTLNSSGFSKYNIKKAFATLHQKPVKDAPVIIKKPKGPGLFARLFSFKTKPIKKPKEAKKQKIQKSKKPEPKKKRGPSVFEKFFHGIKTRVTKPRIAKKIPAKPKPIKKTKPKGPSIFQKITSHKIKPIKIPKIKNIFTEKKAAMMFLIIFFAAIGIIIWIFPASCATEPCFINKANKCQTATFSNIIEGTTFKYETNNCVLRKTVIKMAKDEPENIINEFKGKNMLCVYKENDFSPLYINTISGMLNTCEGELKTSILNYVI